MTKNGSHFFALDVFTIEYGIFDIIMTCFSRSSWWLELESEKLLKKLNYFLF